LDEPAPAGLARGGPAREGLSSQEAARRLRELGPNQQRRPRLKASTADLVRAAANPLVLILLVAAAFSAFLGQAVDAAIIAAIVFASIGVNAWQTLRSDRAVRRLQAQIAPTATVLRDAQWTEVHRAEIVVGDVIRLSAGDLVPADARLLEADYLHVQQAALTGESLPVEKSVTSEHELHGPDAPDLVFLGTSVVSGSGTATVFATGPQTAFGDVVERLAARPDETEFERGTRHFGMLILHTVIFLVLFILVVNVSLGRDPLESVLFSVALAVGLTPEFLPMITTVTLAQGAVQMAREKVIVKHLSSIQNLGSIDVLCSDKTGTLTSGTMSLDEAVDASGQPSEWTRTLAYLNSRLQSGIHSPLDAAILEHEARDIEGWTKTGEIPFEFERRRLSVVAERNGEYLLITKGAPESVIDACLLDEGARQSCLEVFRRMSERGSRVLAVAYRRMPRASGWKSTDECQLTLAGFVTFADHVLPDVATSIAALRRDGVEIKILTGDNELVTRHLCKQVGLDGDHIVLGNELEHLDEPALVRIAETRRVFARVSPAQKHRIIRALKAHGHVVGFLGDGINDAPSLHGADIGISVAGAADIAREAADIVLLERRLSVLHAGILAGRRSFGNVLKYLLMGTSSNFGNMFSMAGAALFLPFLPMLPTQILANNFLYDLAQITIPTDSVDQRHVARPQKWNVRLIRTFMLVMGPISSLFDFATFYVLLRVFRFGQAMFQTGWFLESIATQTLVLFVIRTSGRPWRNRPSVPLATTTILVVVVAFVLPFSPAGSALGFVAPPASYFAFVVGVVSVYLVVVELAKQVVFRRL
jgi:Mg2+-importing ATPase